MPPRPALLRCLLALCLWLPLPALARTAAGHGCTCGSIADEFTALGAGLVREWTAHVPFGTGGWRLDHVVVHDGLVVAQTTDGGVHAVQASWMTGGQRPGTVLWSERVGRPGGPALPAGVGGAVVVVARDLDLFALDRRTGGVVWHEPLGTAPESAAIPAGDWVYTVVSGGGILRMPVELERRPDAVAVAAKATPPRGKPQPIFQEPRVPKTIDAGGPVAFGPVPLADGVLWNTTDGVLVALEKGQRGWLRHEQPLGGPLAGPPAVRGRSVFVATGPSGTVWPATLARFDLEAKAEEGLRGVWRTTLPDHPDGRPFAVGDTVVVSLGAAGIAAVSATSGAPLWHSAIRGTLVCGAGDRIWCLDETGRLSGLDVATGERRAWLCTAGLSVPVISSDEGLLVLAAPGGVLMGFTPTPPAGGARPDAKPTAPAAPTGKESPAVKEPAPAAEEPASEDPDATPF